MSQGRTWGQQHMLAVQPRASLFISMGFGLFISKMEIWTFLSFFLPPPIPSTFKDGFENEIMWQQKKRKYCDLTKCHSEEDGYTFSSLGFHQLQCVSPPGIGDSTEFPQTGFSHSYNYSVLELCKERKVGNRWGQKEETDGDRKKGII